MLSAGSSVGTGTKAPSNRDLSSHRTELHNHMSEVASFQLQEVTLVQFLYLHKDEDEGKNNHLQEQKSTSWLKDG